MKMAPFGQGTRGEYEAENTLGKTFLAFVN